MEGVIHGTLKRVVVVLLGTWSLIIWFFDWQNYIVLVLKYSKFRISCFHWMTNSCLCCGYSIGHVVQFFSVTKWVKPDKNLVSTGVTVIGVNSLKLGSFLTRSTLSLLNSLIPIIVIACSASNSSVEKILLKLTFCKPGCVNSLQLSATLWVMNKARVTTDRVSYFLWLLILLSRVTLWIIYFYFILFFNPLLPTT